MFKFIFKTLLFVFLVFGCCMVYFFGNYTLFRTNEGIHFLKKQDFKLEFKVLDTTNWSFLDFARNPDITREITKHRWNKLKTDFQDGFASLEQRMDNYLDQYDPKNEKRKDWEKQLDHIRSEAKKRYQALEKQAEREGWNAKTLDKEIDRIGDWIQSEMEKIQ